MATDGGGKFKQKRSHGPSKPYERRKSLLGRVTDTVKDLIAPSWLSGLVKTTSAGKPQHEPPGQTGITEESEDEHFMSPPQPTHLGTDIPERTIANNHSGLPQPRTLTHYPSPIQGRPACLPNSRAGKATLQTGQPAFSSAQLPLHVSADSRKADSPRTDDNLSEHSDGSKSTSGCSSMVPHPDKRDYQREILQLNESSLQKLKDQLQVPGLDGASTTSRDLVRSSDCLGLPKPASSTEDVPMSDCGTPGPMSRTWTSGFQTTRQREQNVRSRPSFNVSLFGTTGLGNTSLFGESSHTSSYYPGKVSFGGASQFRKGKMKSTAPYQIAAPYRTQIKAKPMSNSSTGALTSSTAKRILETLERMSTPLSDAKKIPTDDVSLSESVLSFTPGSYHKRARVMGSKTFLGQKSLDIAMRGPPKSQLSTPTIASIAKNRQQLSFTVLDTQTKSPSSATIASKDKQSEQSEEKSESASLKKSESQHSSFARSDTVLLSDSGKFGGKMKRDKSHHYSNKKADGDEVIEIPDLKTDFTLPVTSMPNFALNFGGLRAMCVPASKPAPPTSKAVSPMMTTGSNSPPSLQFHFSSPIQSSKPEVSPGSGSANLNFHFSSPINMKDSESPKDIFSAGRGAMFPRHKYNSQDKTDELKSGSVTDILSGETSSDKSEENFSFGNAVTGGIKENNVNFQCGKTSAPAFGKATLASESGGAFSQTSQLKSGSVMDILGAKTNPTNDSGGFKPASQLKQDSVLDVLGKGTSDPAQSGDLRVWAKLAAFSNSWECDCCMLRNKSQDTKCIACGVTKPSQTATEKTVPSKSGSGSITTGLSTPAGGLWNQFKPAGDSWECPTCMLQNKSSTSKCVACGTQSPAGTKSNGTDSSKSGQSLTNSPGRWNCDTCKVPNRTAQSKCVVCQAPKPGSNTLGSNSTFGNSLLSPLTTHTGDWECDTCMIHNKSSSTKCIACDTPQPGSKSATGNSLSSQFKMPTGDWECDTCMIQNKSTANKCIACETPQPGSKSAAGSATTGGLKIAPNAFSSGPCGFKFDSKSSDNQPATGGFKFGNISADNSSDATGVFKFNTGTADTEKLSNTTGGFKFGTSNTDKENPSNTTGGLQLGSTNTDTDKSTKSTSGFKFGTGSDNTTAEKSSITTGGFKFGGNSMTTAFTKATTGGFFFGKQETGLSEAASNKTENGPGFVLGRKTENNAESDKASVSSGCVFGDSAMNKTSSVAGAKTDKAPVFGNATDIKPNTNIIFGQSGTGNSAEQFGFGAKTLNNNDKEPKLSVEESKQRTGGFNFGSGPSTQSIGVTKPAFGGFDFKKEDTAATSQTSSNTKTSGFGGFTFGKPEDSKPLSNKTSEQTATKRVHDNADCEPIAKKTIMFGEESGKTSTPFSFPAPSATADPAKTGNGPSDLFKFGQQPATSMTPSAGSLGTGGFGSITSGTGVFGSSGTSSQFGNTASSTGNTTFGGIPTPNFGTQSSSFGSNATSVAPFGTAQPPSAIPFGVNANPAAIAASPSLFVTKANTFGGTASTVNAFGAANSFGETTGNSFGSGSTGSFGGNAVGSGFSAFGSNTGGSFGIQANTGAAPAFGSGLGMTATPFGSTPAPTTAPNTTAASTGGFNFSATPSFNFAGSAPAANTAIFQFGAKADAGPSVAAAPVQQPAQPQITQTPSFGMPQPGQQSTPGFNFSSTPSINFGASPAPTGAFTFNAVPADSNPFSVSSSNSGTVSRKIKKAVRKIRK